MFLLQVFCRKKGNRKSLKFIAEYFGKWPRVNSVKRISETERQKRRAV